MTKISNYNKDYLIAEDITCKNCNGNIFEKYDALLIPKKIPRTRSPSGKRFTHQSKAEKIFSIVDIFEGTKKFLPSSALTFSLIKGCLENKNKHKDIENFLEQYKGNRSTYGDFLQNTFFETNNECKIVHYPNKEDLLNGWNCVFINKQFYTQEDMNRITNSKMNQINPRVELPGHGLPVFNRLESYEVKDLIKKESYKKHITDLLGDENFVGTLENFAKFLGKDKVECPTYNPGTHFNNGRSVFTGVGFGGERYDKGLKIGMMGYADMSTTFRYVEKVD